MRMHGLDSTFDGLSMSGKGNVTRLIFMESGRYCLHDILPSPTKRSFSSILFELLIVGKSTWKILNNHCKHRTFQPSSREAKESRYNRRAIALSTLNKYG